MSLENFKSAVAPLAMAVALATPAAVTEGCADTRRVTEITLHDPALDSPGEVPGVLTVVADFPPDDETLCESSTGLYELEGVGNFTENPSMLGSDDGCYPITYLREENPYGVMTSFRLSREDTELGPSDVPQEDLTQAHFWEEAGEFDFTLTADGGESGDDAVLRTGGEVVCDPIEEGGGCEVVVE